MTGRTGTLSLNDWLAVEVQGAQALDLHVNAVELTVVG